MANERCPTHAKPACGIVAHLLVTISLAVVLPGGIGCSRATEQERVDESLRAADQHLAEGRIEAARVEYEKAVRLDPTVSAAQVKLAVIDASRGNVSAAEERFKTVLQRDPENLEALAGWGRLLAATGRMVDAESILQRAAGILGIKIDPEGASELAQRARGTPRIANRLLRRVRDYAEVKGDGKVSPDIAVRAMQMLNVDEQGFDDQDRRLLMTIIEKFDGGPVGIDNLAAAIGEERGTIEDVLEPYLIQQGFIMRTPRGRMATRTAWLHCGLKPPAQQADTAMELFDAEDSEDRSH